MKIYLVGGAIRDELLGLPVKEKDWVVVGSTPDEMKAKGFKQVGKDFPVFIHPKTGEEYALARTERKSGHGYTGFEFDTNPNVTLEEDLERRDLTINAIAQDENGILIDPFNGQEDIKNKKLRHVSDAFSEDPLRVLRIARFKTNLDNFEIVSETMDKLKEIVESGELEYLTPERKWLEFYKANNPHVFTNILTKLNIDELIFGKKMTVPNHLLDENNRSLNSKYTKIQSISWFLYHFFNAAELDTVCDILKIPNEYRDLALMIINCGREYNAFAGIIQNPDEVILLIKKLDIRKKERLQNFIEIMDIKYPGDPLYRKFFLELIDKIDSFKLNKADQKKPGLEIKKIINNAHRKIVQESTINFLNKSN